MGARLAARWAVGLTLVALLIAAIMIGSRYLSLEALRERREALRAAVAAHPVLSLELYAAAYAVLVALSLPGALIFSLAGGYLFGVATGAAAAIVGMSTGATVMFLMARTWLRPRLEPWLHRWLDARGPGARRALEARVAADGFRTLLTLRLIPAAPFALVNVLAGVTGVSVGRYVIATVLGVTPSTVIYCWIGQGLGRLFQRSGALDVQKLIRPQTYLPLILLSAFAAAFTLYNARRPTASRRRP